MDTCFEEVLRELVEKREIIVPETFPVATWEDEVELSAWAVMESQRIGMTPLAWKDINENGDSLTASSLPEWMKRHYQIGQWTTAPSKDGVICGLLVNRFPLYGMTFGHPSKLGVLRLTIGLVSPRIELMSNSDVYNLPYVVEPEVLITNYWKEVANHGVPTVEDAHYNIAWAYSYKPIFEWKGKKNVQAD